MLKTHGGGDAPLNSLKCQQTTKYIHNFASKFGTVNVETPRFFRISIWNTLANTRRVPQKGVQIPHTLISL